jgi:hypothetical protein
MSRIYPLSRSMSLLMNTVIRKRPCKVAAEGREWDATSYTL